MLSVMWIVKAADWRPKAVEKCARLLGFKPPYSGLWRYVYALHGKQTGWRFRKVPYHEQEFDCHLTGPQPIRAYILSALARALGAKATNWCPWDDERRWAASSELNRLRDKVDAMET